MRLIARYDGGGRSNPMLVKTLAPHSIAANFDCCSDFITILLLHIVFAVHDHAQTIDEGFHLAGRIS